MGLRSLFLLGTNGEGEEGRDGEMGKSKTGPKHVPAFHSHISKVQVQTSQEMLARLRLSRPGSSH